MTKYEIMYEELQDKVNSGELTVEDAEILNDMAYERYADDISEYTESGEEDEIISEAAEYVSEGIMTVEEACEYFEITEKEDEDKVLRSSLKKTQDKLKKNIKEIKKNIKDKEYDKAEKLADDVIDQLESLKKEINNLDEDKARMYFNEIARIFLVASFITGIVRTISDKLLPENESPLKGYKMGVEFGMEYGISKSIASKNLLRGNRKTILINKCNDFINEVKKLKLVIKNQGKLESDMKKNIKKVIKSTGTVVKNTAIGAGIGFTADMLATDIKKSKIKHNIKK